MATPTKEVTVRGGDGARTAGQAAEQVRPVAAAASLREAAEAAAEEYGPDEMEKQAQAIGDALLAKLNQQAKDQAKNAKKMQERARQVQEMAGEQGLEVTDLIGPGAYVWWDLLLAGPFQAPAGGGPFLASKVIRAGEPAFFLAVIRRNPAPIPPGGPTAAVLMSAYDYTLRLETINLTNVTNGPDFGPITAGFTPSFFGFLNLHIIPINAPAPPQGNPTLYETNMVVDISGPVAGLPFAGYNTWILDPDNDPALSGATGFFIFNPALGGLVFVPGLPGAVGGLKHDVPARWLVYTA